MQKAIQLVLIGGTEVCRGLTIVSASAELAVRKTRTGRSMPLRRGLELLLCLATELLWTVTLLMASAEVFVRAFSVSGSSTIGRRSRIVIRGRRGFDVYAVISDGESLGEVPPANKALKRGTPSTSLAKPRTMLPARSY